MTPRIQWGALAALLSLAACADQQPTATTPLVGALRKPVAVVQCQATPARRTVTCGAPSNGDIFAGQGTYVKLTSSNVSYNAGTEIFQFDVTVQNLTNEAIGTPDGVVADTGGIKVFFASGPSATSGTGTVTVANADGTGDFTGTAQPFFRYNEILAKDAVSNSKTWQLNIPSTVATFTFQVALSTDVQPLLVINELMANPANYLSTSTDLSGEWVEIYNAGSRPVEMQGLVFADSSQSGRRPYNKFQSAYTVPAGGYVVLGQTANTTSNGGVPVDYVYGSGMAFANSLDAFKIARVYGNDTLTIDRTQYSSAAISAQDGIARELKNPALDNSNMDGSNWGSALATSVYGPGGRGTPKAQNSVYVP